MINGTEVENYVMISALTELELLPCIPQVQSIVAIHYNHRTFIYLITYSHSPSHCNHNLCFNIHTQFLFNAR